MQGCTALQAIFYNENTKSYRQSPTWTLVLTAVAAVGALVLLRRTPSAHPMRGFQARKLLSVPETSTLSLNASYMNASLEGGRNVIPSNELSAFLDPSRPITENFTHVKKLGAGAFGQVGLWQNAAGQKFAIKELRSYVLGSSKNEFAIGLKLDHPNIVKVHNFVTKLGENGPSHYMVMEYIDGSTAARFFRNNSITDDLRLRFADEVIDAFDHMLAKKIVPSDLHYYNIMITKDRSWKFIDLGLYGYLSVVRNQKWLLGSMGDFVRGVLGSSTSTTRGIDQVDLFRVALRRLQGVIRRARQVQLAA